MKVGVCLPIWKLSLLEAERLAVLAEALGYDAIFVPEHIAAATQTLSNYGAHWPDPIALLAYLAARTTRIRLGTSVSVLPYRNPAITAKSVATVDQLSNGRFVLGVGTGWDREEFGMLGLPFDERGAMTDEYLHALSALWGAERPSFRGRYFVCERMAFSPRPIQASIPLWIGSSPGLASRASIRRTVEFDGTWHPVFLSLEELKRGVGMLTDESVRLGGSYTVKFAPRNELLLEQGTTSLGRRLFEGSAEQVASDLREIQGLGAECIVFDVLGCADAAGMAKILSDFMSRVLPMI